MTDLTPYLTALAGMLRRPVEKIDTGALKAWLTHARYVEVSAEDDGAVSAFAVGTMQIAGRLVHSVLYLGDIYGPDKVARKIAEARALIAEVLANGSRTAPFHGEGVMTNGLHVFIYSAPQVDDSLSRTRVAEYIARNKIAMRDAIPAKVIAKKSGKGRVAA